MTFKKKEVSQEVETPKVDNTYSWVETSQEKTEKKEVETKRMLSGVCTCGGKNPKTCTNCLS